MIYLLIKLFFVGFFLNLLYELLHSVLYKTCLEAPLEKFTYLIIKGATFDGALIAILYGATFYVFPAYYQLTTFLIMSLLFAYIWEVHSLKKRKWKYSDNMPKVLGVGVTPLVQLAFTGMIAIYIAINFFV